METRLNRIEQKIDDKFDDVIEKLGDLNHTLVRNTASLELHEKRTDIAEQRLEEFQKKLEHVDTHVKIVNFIFFKAIPAIGGCVLFAKKMNWI